ncbi:hypothetical protein NCAS_0G02840 [Naumovozyma castellii]|uniref:Uncharacterized protein n=1 Tax=Naumovozyma castellii TaxID=27288 RepID=G0VID6_NAUCA|nr:hypothetical protein NCAS_0G02840 [Naumovozyma castellii CBS 4309]CCC71171.1 hypothetical protein NCAS_0G02840 [Naumovozyma castellii CBS 4309]
MLHQSIQSIDPVSSLQHTMGERMNSTPKINNNDREFDFEWDPLEEFSRWSSFYQRIPSNTEPSTTSSDADSFPRNIMTFDSPTSSTSSYMLPHKCKVSPFRRKKEKLRSQNEIKAIMNYINLNDGERETNAFPSMVQFYKFRNPFILNSHVDPCVRVPKSVIYPKRKINMGIPVSQPKRKIRKQKSITIKRGASSKKQNIPPTPKRNLVKRSKSCPSRIIRRNRATLSNSDKERRKLIRLWREYLALVIWRRLNLRLSLLVDPGYSNSSASPKTPSKASSISSSSSNIYKKTPTPAQRNALSSAGIGILKKTMEYSN